jgi:hypothetical protein
MPVPTMAIRGAEYSEKGVAHTEIQAIAYGRNALSAMRDNTKVQS